jgi:hypothetical protein
LPLTLENEVVRGSLRDYVEALGGIVESRKDVIGFVFTINGEINSSDVYGSSELFIKLWPKLLKAAGIEAVAESHSSRPGDKVPDLTQIESFFSSVEESKITEKRNVTERISITTRESDKTVFLETLDRQTMIHRSYIHK